MKYFIALAVVLFAGFVATDEVCYERVADSCDNDRTKIPVCNARFGGIDHVESDAQHHVNLNVVKSYEYLLLATFFNSYQKDRPGFQKLYQGLSDKAFDDTIDMIKQITRRGGQVDFLSIKDVKRHNTLDVNELHSLAIALDNEKQLAQHATKVHNTATHGSTHDPEMAHYMEEKFLKTKAESVRKLSGYANDLAKLMFNADPSLAVYLFNDYLEKQ